MSLFIVLADIHANEVKRLTAQSVVEAIKIDGVLSEKEWLTDDKATGFIQTEPVPGIKASFESEVYFLYDNNAVFIGARLYDAEPNKILKELSLRDKIGNADNFRVFFDTYQSGLNGFNFLLTASGVQSESIVTNNQDDFNWNAVWESAVQIDEFGWSLEIKIPYSSLRFPAAEVQEWKVQFGREIRRFRELSYWNAIDPTVNGWVQQSGIVTGLEKIKSPVRLSLMPYVSGYINTNYEPSNTTAKTTVGTAYSTGLDLKYGINDAFTLDMTLIPDFGQVISDQQILNLGPFEVFFQENRQFFTEGTELFNKGRQFYSRRIGDRPLRFNSVKSQLLAGEKIVSNPDVSQLYNATKITGRLSSGTGIGIFNAVVGEAEAIVMDVDGNTRSINTNPLTNYSAIVVDQNLANNSYVSLMNTNVSRKGDDYDANVTSAFFELKTKDQNYFIKGNGAFSQKLFIDKAVTGHTYNVSLGKISGNWTYQLGHGLETDEYDPNDLGFLINANEIYYFASGRYTQFAPKYPSWQQYRINGSITYASLYQPLSFTDVTVDLSTFLLWKSRDAVGFNTRIQPTNNFDYFEPRTKSLDKFLIIPRNISIGGFFSSDYRKPFAIDLDFNYQRFDATGRKNINFEVAPRIRFNDKFSLFTTTTVTHIFQEPGFVNKNFVVGGIEGFKGDDVLIGNRNRLIVENSITGRFIFNSVMGLNVRIRHYWDQVNYQSFGKLNEVGMLDILSGELSHVSSEIFDQNVNIFNVDLQYNWRFAPGSDVIFVWKNQIYNSDKAYQSNYFENFRGLFEAQQTNSFSIRLLYFLDYLYFFPRKENS